MKMSYVPDVIARRVERVNKDLSRRAMGISKFSRYSGSGVVNGTFDRDELPIFAGLPKQRRK